METPQHGNNSTQKQIKNPQKPLKNWFFWGVSVISSNFLEIPLNSNFEEFPIFFDWFPRIVYPFPLHFIQIFLRDFPIFLRGFPNIFGPFPHFFYPFPLFSKTFKLICFLTFSWSVSSNFKFVFSYFWSFSAFLKNFKNLILLIGFLKFWVSFLIFLICFGFFQKLLKSQFVDQFPKILGPFPHIFYPFPLFS